MHLHWLCLAIKLRTQMSTHYCSLFKKEITENLVWNEKKNYFLLCTSLGCGSPCTLCQENLLVFLYIKNGQTMFSPDTSVQGNKCSLQRNFCEAYFTTQINTWCLETGIVKRQELLLPPPEPGSASCCSFFCLCVLCMMCTTWMHIGLIVSVHMFVSTL